LSVAVLICRPIADALPGAETFASAVAAKLARNDPEVARRTTVFLIDQSHLPKI
jgi:hypothetical protein